MGEILLTPLSDLASSAVKVADKATLDEIKSLLQNSTYGLSALKSTLATGVGTKYPNVSGGYVSSGNSNTFYGKGKIFIYNNGIDYAHSYFTLVIDGVSILDTLGVGGNHSAVNIEFERSCTLTCDSSDRHYRVGYILQLA